MSKFIALSLVIIIKIINFILGQNSSSMVAHLKFGRYQIFLSWFNFMYIAINSHKIIRQQKFMFGDPISSFLDSQWGNRLV